MMLIEYNIICLYLGQFFGFQFYQYCEIEFIFGNKNVILFKFYVYCVELLVVLEQVLYMLLLYDEVICLMVVQGLLVSQEWFVWDVVVGICYEVLVEVVW